MAKRINWLTPQQAEWKRFSALVATDRKAAVEFAAKMKDEGNKNAGRMWLHGPNAGERREIEARWRSIDAVTDRECARHCVTDFLPRA